ncbi:TIGR04211 family SH3 domain-containing protein [Gynuella sunshinyii]|uniref:SH3 domain protein n=1 Tax=Gynuella sunshinyii YC6258 TaxID=1445510 RepID=A0A0C5VT02_9GAMM|nr:TIGR04211 family SH3 domain-containing protein [Gynuella sunshinyii]AJQ96468.1 SH3 domain protein [Gynuella sunshinyii YC6258]
MTRLLALTGLLLALAMIPMPSYAEDKYVTDVLWVPLRSGAGSQYRIINKGLKSGTKLEVLNYNDDEEWAFVRTSGGVEGWVPDRYLRSTPIAEVQLAIVEKELAALKEKLAKTSNSLENIQTNSEETESQLSKLAKEKEELQSELEHIKNTAANAINLEKRNGELLVENERLKNEVEGAQLQVQSLTSSRESRNWIIGGTIMLVGVVLGLILPRLNSSGRKDGWA